MLFDADVLIWLLRRNAQAIETIDRTTDRALSVVTFMELLHGARDKEEVRAVKALLADEGFQMIPLSENIGHRAAIYMEEFGLKTRMSVPMPSWRPRPWKTGCRSARPTSGTSKSSPNCN